jgi:hypothetical protein
VGDTAVVRDAQPGVGRKGNDLGQSQAEENGKPSTALALQLGQKLPFVCRSNCDGHKASPFR